MTMRFKPNVAFTAAVEIEDIIYEWKAFMVSASPTGPGWTVARSSDGTNAGAADYITSRTSLEVGGSWFVLRNPAGTKEIEWHHGNTSTVSAKLAYSKSAGFTGGNTSNRATATDEVFIIGDASNIYNMIIASTTQYWNFGADDASPYGFYAFGWTTASSGATLSGAWVFDPMTSGSYDAGTETDPYVLTIQAPNTTTAFEYGTAGIGANPTTYYTYGCRCWFSSSWQSVQAQQCYDETSGRTVPLKCPQNIMTTKDQMIPVILIRGTYLSAPGGWKGISSLMMWQGTERTNGSTLASLTRICIGDISFPWDGSTTPLVS